MSTRVPPSFPIHSGQDVQSPSDTTPAYGGQEDPRVGNGPTNPAETTGFPMMADEPDMGGGMGLPAPPDAAAAGQGPDFSALDPQAIQAMVQQILEQGAMEAEQIAQQVAAQIAQQIMAEQGQAIMMAVQQALDAQGVGATTLDDQQAAPPIPGDRLEAPPNY